MASEVDEKFNTKIGPMPEFGQSMRIAFLTNEFTTEAATAGGLGTYLNRVTRILCEMGHHPEVFVPSERRNGTIVVNGVTIHTVKIIQAERFVLKALNWLLVRIFRELWSGPARYFNNAWHLARAFHSRDRQVGFDFVQSTNCGCCGLLIRKKKARPHVMRLSSKRDLWLQVDEKKGLGFSAIIFLEKKGRHAGGCYLRAKQVHSL